jgi:hypothetical protein
MLCMVLLSSELSSHNGRMTENPWAIFLNGSYGVGKSSTLNHVADLLADSGQPFSLLDQDWFIRSWPPANPETGNKLIQIANMAAVWKNYRSVGPRQLVVCGVLLGQDDLDRYSSALGLQVRPVRLVASAAVAEQRLQKRYGPSEDWKVDWHVEHRAAVDHSIAAADLDELIIDTDELTPRAVAERILRHFGLNRLEPATP